MHAQNAEGEPAAPLSRSAAKNRREHAALGDHGVEGGSSEGDEDGLHAARLALTGPADTDCCAKLAELAYISNNLWNLVSS